MGGQLRLERTLMLPVKTWEEHFHWAFNWQHLLNTDRVSQDRINYSNIQQVPRFCFFSAGEGSLWEKCKTFQCNNRAKWLIFSSDFKHQQCKQAEISCLFVRESIIFHEIWKRKSGLQHFPSSPHLFVIHSSFPRPLLPKLNWPHQNLLGAWRDLQPLWQPAATSSNIIRVRSSAGAPRGCTAARNTSASSDLRHASTLPPPSCKLGPLSDG